MVRPELERPLVLALLGRKAQFRNTVQTDQDNMERDQTDRKGRQHPDVQNEEPCQSARANLRAPAQEVGQRRPKQRHRLGKIGSAPLPWL